ncbi:response regulator transcription factor [Arcobacter sp. YIC-310]|uniref:response regulator transcription factor n=1 Tax=Arcobacter sp. YIC-310 TaxID=3376632 RepID=UPI003C15E515
MLEKKYRNIKILCIEDEDLIRENQVFYLRRLFTNVYEARSAKEALQLIEDEKPDIVISDIELEDTNGLELIRTIREKDKKTKFIVLSAYSTKEYLLDAIDLGLVKYLIKPVDHDTFFPILLKCAKEVYDEKGKLIPITSSCEFDFLNSVLLYENKQVKLTKYEADFLNLLYENKNSVVRYEQIQDVVWKDNIMTDSSLRTLVKSLRKKLPSSDIVKNLSKVGYKFNI